ncbi:MAG: hypothetical protein OQK54_06280 [Gammaproteobacteria bacterium]|nr:hypothetical protein [Gammaproteobacteria bacterium]
MMPKLATVVLLGILLAGCQQTPVRDEGSNRSRITVGSTLTLNKPLVVPAGHARVFLQYGKVREKVRLKRYQPHCNFEITVVSDGTQRIEPGEFVVTDLSMDEEEVVRRSGPLRYAALQLSDDGDMAPQIALLIHHKLHAEGQPQVMRLTCHGGFADPWQAEYPSVSAIREALGEWVTLELADR